MASSLVAGHDHNAVSCAMSTNMEAVPRTTLPGLALALHQGLAWGTTPLVPDGAWASVKQSTPHPPTSNSDFIVHCSRDTRPWLLLRRQSQVVGSSQE